MFWCYHLPTCLASGTAGGYNCGAANHQWATVSKHQTRTVMVIEQ